MSALKVGGNNVHRVRERAPGEQNQAANQKDVISIEERYQQLAAFVHRTGIVPRDRGYMWACSCGRGMGVLVSGGPVAAQHAATGHVLDEAAKMQDVLEGQPTERQTNNGE